MRRSAHRRCSTLLCESRGNVCHPRGHHAAAERFFEDFYFPPLTKKGRSGKIHFLGCPGGEIGRRTSFRCWRLHGREGSSPFPGTSRIYEPADLTVCGLSAFSPIGFFLAPNNCRFRCAHINRTHTKRRRAARPMARPFCSRLTEAVARPTDRDLATANRRHLTLEDKREEGIEEPARKHRGNKPDVGDGKRRSFSTPSGKRKLTTCAM